MDAAEARPFGIIQKTRDNGVSAVSHIGLASQRLIHQKASVPQVSISIMADRDGSPSTDQRTSLYTSRARITIGT